MTTLRTTTKKIKRTLPFYGHYKTLKTLLRDPHSYLHQTGWLKSLLDDRPVDKDGAATPWMNYPVVAFLRDRLTKDLDLFEYGSGHSTLFFARLVKSVTSVESNEAWFHLLKNRLPDNAELKLAPADPDAGYCRAILGSGRKYDVVVVDGVDRVNCLKQALAALTPAGVMILDDSQRDSYAEGISFLRANGFLALFFEGLKPASSRVERTTVFYRPQNCLGI